MRTPFSPVLMMLAVFASVTQAAPPASVQEAAAVIDLARWNVDGISEKRGSSIAQFSGEARGLPNKLYVKVKQQLLEAGWEESPQAYSTDQSASATFTKAGYTLSVSIFPSTNDGRVTLTVQNHGNVDVRQLPVPPGATPLFAGPVSAMFTTTKPTEETAAAVKSLLLAQGWEPYGTAGDVAYYKQNAVRLSARAAAAPAQGGKTIIDYSTLQMSADLPAPATAENVQYSDAPTQLSLDSQQSLEELVQYFKKELAPRGWQATTDNPLKQGFRHELIFRNPAGDLLTLQLHAVDGKQRILLRQQSAEEVADLERKALAKIEADKKQAATPKPQLTFPMPSGAHDVQHKASMLEFKLKTGAAQSTIATLRKSLANEGWKEVDVQVERNFGTVELSKGDQKLLIVYLDPGLIPAEVTVTSHGFDLLIEK